MSSTLSSDLETEAIKIVRGLAMDAPLHAKSGHQGTAMALAPLAHVLYSRVMRHHPADPEWPDRDRFVLSNGHASILQYSMLYLCGYGLELDDLKAFRSFGSRTPGHPEAGHTPGIEVTTGPLGQGFANAVGMAIAERVLRERFGAGLVDHHTWAIAGDGCLMEGVSHEAASLAGHLGLGRLNVVFDDNRITIDGPTQLATTDDVGQRFEAYGWHVEYLGEIADDCDALEEALLAAKAVEDRPSLLILRSHVGTPSPKWTDHHEAHGNPFTAEDVTATKAVLGIPDEPFWTPPDVVAAYRETGRRALRRRLRAVAEDASKRSTPTSARRGTRPGRGTGTAGWEATLPTFEQGEKVATRQAIGKVLAACVDSFPGLVSGAADLTGNTGTKLPDAVQQTAETPGGRQIYYGVREHAMGSAMVGMARHGGILPVGGTFFVFLDYMRPPVRLASLSRAKVVFVFTHDSVGVGEDGPTHQPVEHVATLRAIPDLQVIRPADANETVEAWKAAVDHDGPTALGAVAPGHPRVHRRLGRRPWRRRRPRGGGRSAARHRRHRQRGRRRHRRRRSARRRRHRHPGREPAVVGPPRPPGPRLPRGAVPARRSGAVRRGGDDARMGALRRRLDRHRSLRRQRSRRRRPRRAGHQRRPRRASRRGRCCGAES